MLSKPEGLYHFRTGKLAGKSVEWLMFNNYPLLLTMRSMLHDTTETETKKSELQQHIEWIIKKSESLPIRMQCPQCKIRPAKYLSVYGNALEGFSIGTYFTCCDKEGCKSALSGIANGKPVRLYPLNFSIMEKFPKKSDRHAITKVLKACYMLPNQLKEQTLFDFFHE